MNEPEPLDASQLDIDLMRQIDAICRRFEADWRAGARRPLDNYLADVPDETRAALRAELEALERELRQSEETGARQQSPALSGPRRRPSRRANPPTSPVPGVARQSVHEDATVPPARPGHARSARWAQGLGRPRPHQSAALPHPLLRRLRDHPRDCPRRHGRRLPGPAGQPQSARRPEDDPRRAARQRDRRQALLHRGRGGGQPRSSRHRADLRGRPARGPALFLDGLRRGAKPRPTPGRGTASAPRSRRR